MSDPAAPGAIPAAAPAPAAPPANNTPAPVPPVNIYVPQAPAPAAPVAAAGVDDGTHPGWAPGAFDRFTKTRQQLAAMQDKVATHDAAAATWAAEKVAFEAAATTAVGGILALGSVQRLVLSEHDMYKIEAGDKAQTFTEWLSSEAVRSDPLYAVHFPKVEAAAPALPPLPVTQVAPAAAERPNPNAGTQTVQPLPTSATVYTDEQIRAISANPAQFKAHKAAIAAHIANKYR